MPTSRYRLIAGLLALTLPAAAHDIVTTNLTYSRDISRIFARRCVQCHGSGSPISLTTYQEVRPWAVDIKEQVLGRAMPPWGAVKGFGSFSPDNGLTQEELLIISAWAIGGAPEGNPAMLPKAISSPPVKMQPLEDALRVSTQATLAKPIVLCGIEPTTSSVVPSMQITALLPDGHIEPLVWLYQYDPKQKHPFRFREPIVLPAGTRVEATSALDYVLKTSPHNALTGMVKTVVFTVP
jgi:hypothetical protein